MGFLDGYKTYDTNTGYGNAREWRNEFKSRMTGEEAETIIKESKETPYSILGVSLTATQAEIKKAFRKLMNEWHPDRNSHRIEEATVMSQKIIAAYTVLTS